MKHLPYEPTDEYTWKLEYAERSDDQWHRAMPHIKLSLQEVLQWSLKYLTARSHALNRDLRFRLYNNKTKEAILL